MRRRDLFALPVAALLPAPAGYPPERSGRVVRLVLNQADPYAQLERLWHFGAPVRVVARAHPAWWPSPVELPDRWQAWVETLDGSTVVVVCRPLEAAPPPNLDMAGRVTSLIAQSLRIAG
ncbi:hypothetical protein [Paludibaculum fermentans]|uniref:Uncharacterized protein n=1 Tax=Paludibaculum fermentans TaxID=1473598 RepID=A0A7S7NSU8_PALFE|nr:hypothetical protein [Paludibaculum fermentans]QOY89089.1 hypothetical protein IRI77_03775 [Paludibaculum fermentans]